MSSAEADEEAWLAAAKAGDLFTIKELFARASEPKRLCSHQTPGVSSSGHSATHWLAAGGHHLGLKWLLAQPENADATHMVNRGGSTPLHSAAANGHCSCVQLLLEAGVDQSREDSNGDTAFAAAASRIHEAAARPLAALAPPHVFLKLSIGGNRAGVLVFALDETVAPRACANFMGLCEGFRVSMRRPGALYGRDGTMGSTASSVFLGYRGTTFHRLLPDQLLHGGRLAGGDTSVFGSRIFEDEHAACRVNQDARGLLCMANSGPDSNASQFFVTLAPCPHLEGRHVVFGRLVGGDEILATAEAVPANPTTHQPVTPITITDCGRWPSQPPRAATSNATTFADGKEASMASLRSVGAAAETSRAAVASAVAEGLLGAQKRSRGESEGIVSQGAESSDDERATSRPRTSTSGGNVAWDPLGGMTIESDDESDDDEQEQS